MASLTHTNVIFLCLIFSLFALFTSIVSSSELQQPQGRNNRFLSSRRLLFEDQDLESQPIKNKIKTTTTTSSSSSSSLSSSSSSGGSKNKTKLIKPSDSTTKSKTTDSTKSTKTTSALSKEVKDQPKLIKSTSTSSKNKTKTIKSSGGSELSYNSKQAEENGLGLTQLDKSKLAKNKKKLDSSGESKSIKNLDKSKTSKSVKESTSSSTKSTSSSPPSSSSEKPKKKKESSSDDLLHKQQSPPKKYKKTTTTSTPTNSDQTKTKKQQSATKSNDDWLYTPEDDLVTEFKTLPTKFHDTFVPDLQRISTTSKLYLTKSHTQFTKGYIKPYVGNKYAPAVATAVSCIFIIIPLLLVSLLFNRIKAYFSLQKLLIFVQVYLSIYFTILCLSSLATGLEPLRFFYATSPATYVWLQALQTLGYVVYLLLLLMYLVLLFSTVESGGVGLKFLGLAQTVVGFAVGVHYYVAVVHRMVRSQPPKTNWKVHGIYAACFLLICIGTRAERRKKAYLVEDGEEGKLS